MRGDNAETLFFLCCTRTTDREHCYNHPTSIANNLGESVKMTEQQSQNTFPTVLVSTILLSVGIAVLESLIHRWGTFEEAGISFGLLYVAVLVLAFSSPQKRIILQVAAIVTLLCLLEYAIRPHDWGTKELGQIANTVLTIFVIWTTAILGYQRKVCEEQLRTANVKLDHRIQERTNELQVAFDDLQREVECRKKTQAAFENEKMLVDELMSVIPDNIYFKDEKGIYIRINQAKASRSGLSSPDEAIGKSDFDYFPREHALKAQQAEKKILESGNGLIDVEERLVWPDGRVTWVSATKMPLRKPDGTIIGTMGISRDITHHHEIATQLEHERDRLRTLIDHLPDFVFIKDKEGNFVTVNRALTSMYGKKSEQELVGKNDFEFSPHELAQAYRNDDLQVMKTRKPLINREEENLLADGSRRWLLTTKVALTNHRNEVVGLVGIARDITKRKKAEQELQSAKEAAEVANRAKSEFLANMSHEIRTPMNAIIGMSELVLDTELTAQQRDYLETVLNSAESLLGIINDILDFSKIESGRFELESYPIDLREWLGDSVKPLALRAHSKKLELAYHISPEVPPYVRGDALRLRQVIVNLLGNAIKFTHKGEVILDVSVEEDSENQIRLHFRVSDTGVGMTPETQERVFNAFEQADMSTTREFGGTGLGLTISSRLVNLMGGKVWIESKLGRGSTFHFSALFEHATRDEVPKSLRESASLDGLHVLIVDDNKTNRQILNEMCTNWRMDPVAVENVSLAIQQLTEAFKNGTPFDLVITDASMPDVDGFTLAEKIKDDEHLGSTIVMMLTSLDRTEDIRRCEELSIKSYLTKPIKQSDLFDAIMAAVDIDVSSIIDADANTAEAIPRTRPLKILLAEDSLANQKLAVGLLSKWNHSVTVANNGREAVDAIQSDTFDIVLMDVQMPELDGLGATKEIRTLQAQNKLPEFPIVAMTAHAMKGDRERCLESGMDEYVSKPVRPFELATVIAKFFNPLPVDEASTSEKPASLQIKSSAEQNVLDWDVLLKNTYQDEELAFDVADAFLIESPGIFQKLESAIAEKEQSFANRYAHTLKGSLKTLGAPSSELAAQLETLTHEEKWDEAEAIYQEFAKIFPKVIEEVKRRLQQKT